MAKYWIENTLKKVFESGWEKYIILWVISISYIQTTPKPSSLIQYLYIYFIVLWVVSLDWVQLVGSAAVGHTKLILAGLAHESVICCQVLWGMTCPRQLRWVSYLYSPWALILWQACLGWWWQETQDQQVDERACKAASLRFYGSFRLRVRMYIMLFLPCSAGQIKGWGQPVRIGPPTWYGFRKVALWGHLLHHPYNRLQCSVMCFKDRCEILVVFNLSYMLAK